MRVIKAALTGISEMIVLHKLRIATGEKTCLHHIIIIRRKQKNKKKGFLFLK